MAFHVTQCPGCDSTFNTSARLLESAAGRVRCGSCLTVFEAMQYFVDQSHILSDDLVEDSVFVGNNPQDYFDPTNFLTRSALTNKMSALAFTDVEITAEVPLAESEPNASPSQSSQFESGSDSWQETIDPQQVLPAESYHEEETGFYEAFTEFIPDRALQADLRDEEALEEIAEENLAVLNQVSTPVELLGSSETRWLRQGSLATVMVLLAAILTAQFLWQRMAVYSQLTQIRPFYEFGCRWLTCDLPVYSNIDAIRSDNLALRSHPQRADALLVNVKFRNTADFPQAFPILILSFDTAANGIVALREFSPAEYLDPGLLSVSLMPVAIPIQITLEVIDPGPDAVNYTLAFRRPSVFN